MDFSAEFPPVLLARYLHRAGRWDAALAVLGDSDPDLRAEILVDRLWWRLDDPTEAESAIAKMDPATPRAALARGQVGFTRLTFSLDPLPDVAAVTADFGHAEDDDTLSGWASFWLGVTADNIRHDRDAARRYYDEAALYAQVAGDLFLESYVVRHLADHATTTDPAEAELLFRRSLELRSALGARPQVAAAQATLADVLPPGPERTTLVEAAQSTARDLGLTWLVQPTA
jgi:hypothetical protein